MQVDTNGNSKSKILAYMCTNSPPFSKKNLARALNLSDHTIDARLGSLRRDGFVKTIGNGYWAPTPEGIEQFKTDPLLPAESKAKSSSRVFSLGNSISYIEHDYYCKVILKEVSIDYDPNLLLPVVLLWLKSTNQITEGDFEFKMVEQYGEKYSEGLIAFFNGILEYHKENKEIKEIP